MLERSPWNGHNFQWATGGWLWNSLGKAHMEPRQINTQLLWDKFRYQRVKSIGGFYILFMWIANMAENDNNTHVHCVRYIGMILCMSPANERWRYSVTLSLIGWAHTQNHPWIYCYIHGLMQESGAYHIDWLVQERCNSIANALELHLSCTNPSIWFHSVTGTWTDRWMTINTFYHKRLGVDKRKKKGVLPSYKPLSRRSPLFSKARNWSMERNV